jgi:hypothetical protein
MVTGIQVFGAVFGIILCYFTFLHYKRQEFTFKEFLGWEALWLAFLGATLFPEAFQVFSKRMGALRPFDFFSVLGFFVSLSISFYTYVNLDKVRKKMEKALRDMALADLALDDRHKAAKD